MKKFSEISKTGKKLSPETVKQINDFLKTTIGLSPELVKAGVDALIKALEKK